MKAAMKAVKTAPTMNEEALATEYRNFTRDPLMIRTVMLMENSGLTNTIIKNRCGVSWPTLQSWRKGKTKRGQVPTMRFILRSLGHELTIKKS